MDVLHVVLQQRGRKIQDQPCPGQLLSAPLSLTQSKPKPGSNYRRGSWLTASNLEVPGAQHVLLSLHYAEAPSQAGQKQQTL